MQINTESIAARIAARKALGMTAEEYNQHERHMAECVRRERSAAVRQAIQIGITGTSQQIDAAIDRCRAVGAA